VPSIYQKRSREMLEVQELGADHGKLSGDGIAGSSNGLCQEPGIASHKRGLSEFSDISIREVFEQYDSGQPRPN